MAKILVTGATGSTGGGAIDLLLKKGHAVRALAHNDDSRTTALRDKGVEVVFGDLLDLNQIAAAAKGIERAYFVYPIKPGILQATSYFAEVAKENKFEFIVNMSQISARREAVSHAAQDHWIAERVFDWSGIPTAHLRPTFFAEWLLYQADNIIHNGQLTLPYSGRHAPVAAIDQSHVIANILDNPFGHGGQVYPLFGPDELTQEEIAEQVGLALNRKIAFQHAPFDEFFKAMTARSDDSTHNTAQNLYGGRQDSPEGRVIRDFMYNHLKNVSEDHDAGIFSGTNDNVKKIGGVPGTTIRQFIELHADKFKAPVKS